MKTLTLLLSFLSLAQSFPLRKNYLRNWETLEDIANIKHPLPAATTSPKPMKPTISNSAAVTPGPTDDLTMNSSIHSFFTSIGSEAKSIYEDLEPSTSNILKESETSFDNLETSTKNTASKFYIGASEVTTNAAATISTAAIDTYHKVSNVSKNAANTISNAAVNTYDKVSDVSKTLYNKASNASTEAYEKIADATTSWWDSTTNWFSSAFSSVGDFFSSGWNKVVVWWRELEDEVKEVIHIIIRIVEVGIGIAILVAVIWGYCKVRKAYSFVKKHALDQD